MTLLNSNHCFKRNLVIEKIKIKKSSNKLISFFKRGQFYFYFGEFIVVETNGSIDKQYSFVYNTSEQTRYYDPEIGHFISPDSTKYLDPESIGGLNLYAYCNNDPVNRFDPSGHFPILYLKRFGKDMMIRTGIKFLYTYLWFYLRNNN